MTDRCGHCTASDPDTNHQAACTELVRVRGHLAEVAHDADVSPLAVWELWCQVRSDLIHGQARRNAASAADDDSDRAERAVITALLCGWRPTVGHSTQAIDRRTGGGE